MSQEKKTVSKAKASEPEAIEDAPTESTSQVDEDDFDAVLDEIDNVLEENAQAFVEGYVQKGGQ